MPVVTLNETNTKILDTYIHQAAPTSNYNPSSNLYIGFDGQNQINALVHFDLGLIPNDAIINSATFKIYKGDGSAARSFDVHKITSLWDSATVTWNTRPAYAATKSGTITTTSATGFFTCDVTSLVQEWVNGTVNYGVLVRDAGASNGNSTLFYAVEDVNSGTGPTLTIDYTIPSTGKKQVEYVGNGGLVNQSTPVANYTMPIPASAQVGDLLVAQFTTGNASNVSLPTGWMPLVKDHNTNISQSFVIAYKTKAASEPSPTFTSATATIWAGTMHVFRNVKAVKTGMVNRLSSNINCSPPATSTDVDKTVFVLFNNNTSGATFTPPLNYSEIAEILGGSTGVLQASMRYMYSNRSQSSAEMTSVASVAVNGISASMVLEPIVNNPPSLTLTSPSDNQTLAEGNTMLVSGEASDADSGNVLTVKYKINNGTARAIASGVSDGSSPLSFAKSLTYSNKRLWDGAVDVTGADLAENVDHVLTVWAEDDQGGKSEEVTRKFQVIWNRPPTISGENSNLGIMEEPPSVEYTVTDPETNPFTITEKINGEVIRTFAGAAGQQETVTIPPDMWLRLEPGVQHALTIEASDDQGMTSTRTYTLTRFVDKIVFSLDFATMQQETKDFFTTDVAAKRLLLTPIWDLPPGAILLVEVCNNAYDEEPSWEDATIVVKLNRAHLFSNETKTADKWGINFRFQIEKGSATQPIYLKGVGGAFD